MTVTLDSPAGLPVEKDYPREVQHLRGQGARMVEYGSLALVRRRWKSGASTLLSMAAVWLSRNVLDASHIVIGVHPRAVPIYRALYGFCSMGTPQKHAELNAPVQGMVCGVERFLEVLQRCYPRPMASGLPIAHHFREVLPPCVEINPLGDGADWARWKMPREVFQELFVGRSDRLRTLDPQTRAYLEVVRSPRTFEVDVNESLRLRATGLGFATLPPPPQNTASARGKCAKEPPPESPSAARLEYEAERPEVVR